jgi:cyanophycinase
MNAPKGKLILIGGNEAKDQQDERESEQLVDFEHGILKEVIKEIRGSTPRIEVIPFASKKQKELEKIYTESFARLGIDVGFLLVNEKDEVDQDHILKRIEKADGVFLTGGDQLLLTNMLSGTRFLDILREKYWKEDFVIAGTSAGAMVVSDCMIDSGYSDESLLKGTVVLADGLGLLPRTVVDTHFLSRGRFSRITDSLLQKRNHTGIGICEDTAVIVYHGNELRATGSGTVMIIEMDDLKSTNYDLIQKKEPVFVENMRVHLLAKGSGYLLKEKQFVA